MVLERMELDGNNLLFNLDDNNLLFNLDDDDELLFNDEFDNITYKGRAHALTAHQAQELRELARWCG